MIDEQLDAEFEALLIATLHEMISKAHNASAHALQIEAVGSNRPVERIDSSSVTRVELALTSSRAHTPRRRRSAVIGSVLVAAAGVAALLVVQTRDTHGTYPATSQQSPASSPATLRIPDVEDENSKVPYGDVAVAAGTVGWFQLGDVSPALAERIGRVDRWSDAYTSTFFRCVDWGRSAATFTCTRLQGGNDIDHTRYGTDIAVGVLLGDGPEAASVLWNLAQGSLWGYDTVTTPPAPTEIAVGSAVGLSYRNADDAYLVWQRAPGVIVWLKTTGFTDAELGELATSVEPVQLPATLPLVTEIGTKVTDVNNTQRSMQVATIDGVRCAGVQLYNECTRVDQGPALVRTHDQSAPVVGAITASGSSATLVVALAGGGTRSVPLVDTGLGLQSALYTPADGETMVSAQLIDATGAIVRTIDLAPAATTSVTTAVSQPALASPSDIALQTQQRLGSVADVLATGGFTLLENVTIDPTSGYATIKAANNVGITLIITVTPGTTLQPENHQRVPLVVTAHTDYSITAQVASNDGWVFDVVVTRAQLKPDFPTTEAIQTLLYQLDP